MHRSSSSGLLSQDPPQVEYLWKSSIPPNWIKLKGQEYFRPVDPLKKNINMMEFLRRTQLCLPKTDSNEGLRKRCRARMPAFDSISVPRSEEKSPPSQPAIITLNCAGFAEPKAPHPLFLAKVLKPRSQTFPLKDKATSYQVTTLLLDPGDKQLFKGYVVNKYARPNGLIQVQRMRDEEGVHMQQSQNVKDFLERFDGRKMPELPPRGRRGLNGWKLTKARSSNKSLTLDYDFESGREENQGDESYLGNLRLRRKN